MSEPRPVTAPVDVVAKLSGTLAIPPAPAPPPSLSVRQIEMLHLMSYGLTHAEIGRRLFIHEDTVKRHLRRAYSVLGARGRAHAVRLGLQRGVLKFDTN